MWQRPLTHTWVYGRGLWLETLSWEVWPAAPFRPNRLWISPGQRGSPVCLTSLTIGGVEQLAAWCSVDSFAAPKPTFDRDPLPFYGMRITDDLACFGAQMFLNTVAFGESIAFQFDGRVAEIAIVGDQLAGDMSEAPIELLSRSDA